MAQEAKTIEQNTLGCGVHLDSLQSCGFVVDSVSSYLYLSEKCLKVSIVGNGGNLQLNATPEEFATILATLGWKS